MAGNALTESARETLAVFETSGRPGEPLTTTEVAEGLDVSRRSTYTRLERLSDRGLVETKKVGARGRVWWRPADGGTDDPAVGEGGSDHRTVERDLLERAIEAAPVGMAVFGPDGDLERANSRARELLAIGDADGSAAPTLYDEDGDPIPPEERPHARVRATGERVEDWTAQLERPDGDRQWLSITAVPVVDGTGVVERVVTAVEDVTRFEQRARRLARQRGDVPSELEAGFERIDDAFIALDEQWRFTYVSDRAETVLDRSGANLLGRNVWKEFPEAAGSTFQAQYERAVETQRPVSFEEYYPPLETWFEVIACPSETGLSVYFWDVTERVERERSLALRVRQQEVVADLGERALVERDVDALMAEAAELVAETLDTGYCTVLDLDVEAEELLLRQGVGWQEEVVGSAVADDSQAAYTLASEEPVVIEDLAAETRFDGPNLLTDHDIRSGISTRIGPQDDPWGILGTYDTAVREFSPHDVTFVQSVANILASAIERCNRERRLTHQREQLAALNDLNEVVRGITDAVLDRSTREDIERATCERLVAADSYALARLFDADLETGEISLRTAVGPGAEEIPVDVEFSIDSETPLGEGPAPTAFRTREMQVSRDTLTDSAFEPLRETVETQGFRSCAAIPIAHEDTLYGVIGVYAERPNAFAEPERTILGKLGEIVGHAIAAAERKRALLSDDLIELDVRVGDFLDALDVDAANGGPIVLEEAVPLGGDEYLVYGTASPDAVQCLQATAAAHDHWEEVTVREREDVSDVRVELRLSDPPVLSKLSSLGGAFESASIEDGDFKMTLHLAPGTEVRRMVDAFQDAPLDGEMVTRRRITRPDDPAERLQRAFAEELTDRQRACLRAAYHAGFFEWPRASSGETVADSLEISPPTFHQHLRAAQLKLFESLLSTPVGR